MASLTKRSLLSVTLAFFALSLQAATRNDSIRSLFAQINDNPKGPLGKNVYQRPAKRTQVLQGGTIVSPPHDTLFTAAFRNELADKLAALDFYVGSRFSTNYWELHNKYLATPKEQKALAFNMDHKRLVTIAEIEPEARSMSRHMLMEQFYMRKFPQTKLTRANMQRGTADADNETKFYGLFVDYLARTTSSESEYLGLYEMQRRYNLTGDSSQVSLQKLRDMVANIYDRLESEYYSYWNPSDPAVVADFRSIRNAIHNYMTPEVLKAIDKFIATYKNRIDSYDLADVKRLREWVVAYYKIDKKKLIAWANRAGSSMPANTLAVIGGLTNGANTLADLEALSQLTVAAHDAFWTNHNLEINHWIIGVNTYVQTQLGSKKMAGDDWVARMRIALDLTFASGLVGVDLYDKVRHDLANPQPKEPEYVRARIADIDRVFAQAHKMIVDAMTPAIQDWTLIDSSMDGFADDTLRASFLTELDQISTHLKKNIPKVPTKYSIENEGEAYGYLIYVPASGGSEAVKQLDPHSIPVFEDLPLDLGVVAGIITEKPQTPLSHVSIKSKARGTPDLYWPNASRDPELKDLVAKRALVHIIFRDGKATIVEASLAEAQAYWKTHGGAPVKVDVKANLKETRIRSTKDLHVADSLTVGAKAANYGEAERAVGGAVIQEGLAIPFFYYKQFVDTNMYDDQQTLSQRIKAIVEDPKIKTDRDYLVRTLEDLQKRMVSNDMVVNAELVADLEERTAKLQAGRAFKFRSSTNSEDLPNFSGAGLYDSYKYDPKKPKKTVESALKKTWASVWNLRAFDERELFGINHLKVYMAILVSPAFDSEAANGVAVTRNIVQPDLGKGLYINTQLGEEAVTNPNPNLTPEELIVLDREDTQKKIPYVLKYLKYSPLSPNGPIMTDDEVTRLSKYLVKIHNAMKKIMDPKNKNKKFSIDAEFKIDVVDGKRQVFIKQARPYIAH